MSEFAPALEFMLPHEGGSSNNPKDKGGKTKYGITQASLDRFNHDRPGFGLPADVYALLLKDAEVFYANAGYWLFAGVESQQIASKLFDMSVNMGPRQAVRLAQSTLGVTVDGSFGPKTMAAINAQAPSEIIPDLCAACIQFYYGIVTREPDQAVFLKGWLSRARSVPQVIG